MTNAPIGRRTHVIRILGTNKAGEILQDIWADVERIDKFLITSQAPGETVRGHNWQEVTIKLRWMDDPDDPDNYAEDGNPNREHEIIKVCDPSEEDLSDPEEWIPVPAIKRFKLSKINGMTTQKRFLGRALNDFPVVEARRICHYDTNIDGAAQAAFNDDPERKVYVVKGYEYTRDDDTKDEDQYVEHEIVTHIRKQDSHNLGSNGNDQERFLRLKSQYLIDESDDAQFDETGENGRNPPYRLDPFQNIINVKLAPTEEIVYGITPNNIDNSTTEISSDGYVWGAGFGSSSNAASGLGYTVVCSGGQLIAFGKPRDGAKCFIATDTTGIQRGTLNSRGEMSWQSVGGVSDASEIMSCSFAGGAFFVAYSKESDKDTRVHYAVSFDGENFTDVNPFNGVASAANGTNDSGDPTPYGGSVAYNKETGVYVTTGWFHRHYEYQFDIGDGETAAGFTIDLNFMSSVSRNGITWTPKFDTAECTGFPPPSSSGIGGSNNRSANVAFGNGVFVAATSFKESHPSYTGPSFSPFLITKYIASVAKSPDGVTWYNAKIPNAVFVAPAWTVVGSHGFGIDVKYVKTSKSTDGKGFFVLCVSESETGTNNTAKVLVSQDGSSWQAVKTDSDSYGWIFSIINKSRGTIVYL